MSLLKSGSRGEAVRRLQVDLTTAGYAPGAADGIFGERTGAAVRAFQAAEGLAVDGIAGPAARGALDARIAGGGGGGGGGGAATSAGALPPGAVDWRARPLSQRRAHVVDRLVTEYGYAPEAAAGLVGSFESESGVVPYTVEGDRGRTLRCEGHDGQVRDFTPEEVRDRSSSAGTGPRLPGVGLAQWTAGSRRSGLFAHRYGTVMDTAMLFDMDAQVDYTVTELRSPGFRRVQEVLSRAGVTVDEAADEVAYVYEAPGRVFGPKGPDGRRPKLPRSDPSVQAVFRQRREHAHAALADYRASRP